MIPRKLQLWIQVTTDSKLFYRVIPYFTLLEDENLALENI